MRHPLGRASARAIAAAALMALALSGLGGGVARAAETLRLAVLQYGTVNWELEAIRARGLDAANGFRLEVAPVAGSAAAKLAFEGGTADAVVADWIWVARRRSEGADVAFLPYSRSVGGILVPGDSSVREIADLKGRKIGVAGGPLDKSWLILQRYARAEGIDLAAETEPVFGAPPLIFEQAVRGRIDAVITFWHYGAKLEARGFRPVVETAAAAEALGLDPETPLLGYVFKGAFVAERPTLIRGFAKASREAKRLLLEDDAIWETLRPLMNAESDAAFERLKAGFRAGIPQEAAVDEAAAARMFAVLAEAEDGALTGGATTLPEGVFLKLDD